MILWSTVLCHTSLAAYTSNYSEPTITLRRGTYGTGVKWLQDMLNHNGYSLTIDGEFGNATYTSVTNFQAKHELQVDGIVGTATKTALKKYAGTTNSGKYQYTTTRVHFRSGPSTSYTSYQVLNVNTKVYVIRQYDANWSYCQYNNRNGYVSSQYLRDTATTIATVLNSNGLPAFARNASSLLSIIQNCKAYYASHPFYYSTANGVRSIPADQSTNYSGKYYTDCSSFVTWALYEYASANGNTAMKNYFSYQRNSATFASIGASDGNAYLKVIDQKTTTKRVNLSLAKPGDILVSPGHVEFFQSYTNNSANYVTIKVYNCGSNASIKNAGVTTSATLNPNEITYILRVK